VEENTAGNDEWGFGGSGPPITASGITYVTHQYTLGSTSLIYPTGTAGAADTAYYGPNFEFTTEATPEPSSIVLATLGTAFLLLLNSRRNRRHDTSLNAGIRRTDIDIVMVSERSATS
jgi:hypothetical protein